MAETGMERVAKALRVFVHDNDAGVAREAARAAIEATRTPTQAMQAAKDAIDMSEATDAIWTAMIDSLLKEEGQ